MCCHTEIQVADIKCANLPNHSILTLGQPVPVLTLYHQGPGGDAMAVAILKPMECLDLQKAPWADGFEAEYVYSKLLP